MSFNAYGDVVQLTNTSGTVTKNYRYDSFGVEQGIDSVPITRARSSRSEARGRNGKAAPGQAQRCCGAAPYKNENGLHICVK